MYHIETVGNEQTATFPYAVVGPFGIVNRHTHRANAESQAAYYATSGRDPAGIYVRYLLRVTKTLVWHMQRVDAAGWIGPQAEAGVLESMNAWERDLQEAHGPEVANRIHAIASEFAFR